MKENEILTQDPPSPTALTVRKETRGEGCGGNPPLKKHTSTIIRYELEILHTYEDIEMMITGKNLEKNIDLLEFKW